MQWLLQPLGNIYCAAFPNAEIVEVGFEPTKHMQRILSPPPLTTRELNSSREPKFPCDPSSSYKRGRGIETISYNDLAPPFITS